MMTSPSAAIEEPQFASTGSNHDSQASTFHVRSGFPVVGKTFPELLLKTIKLHKMTAVKKARNAKGSEVITSDEVIRE
ncbi:hypothetical protein JTB14_021673 [Gonioctena quinquepunctata]|nr:hypothetical protein JTB14_021673 [Gonioctena quinquepunctata]